MQLDVTGLAEAERQASTVSVWDGPPNLITSQLLFEGLLVENNSLQAPVTPTVVVTAPGEKSRSMDVYDASGVAEIVERIASGAEREMPTDEREPRDRISESRLIAMPSASTTMICWITSIPTARSAWRSCHVSIASAMAQSVRVHHECS